MAQQNAAEEVAPVDIELEEVDANQLAVEQAGQKELTTQLQRALALCFQKHLGSTTFSKDITALNMMLFPPELIPAKHSHKLNEKLTSEHAITYKTAVEAKGFAGVSRHGTDVGTVYRNLRICAVPADARQEGHEDFERFKLLQTHVKPEFRELMIIEANVKKIVKASAGSKTGKTVAKVKAMSQMVFFPPVEIITSPTHVRLLVVDPMSERVSAVVASPNEVVLKGDCRELVVDGCTVLSELPKGGWSRTIVVSVPLVVGEDPEPCELDGMLGLSLRRALASEPVKHDRPKKVKLFDFFNLGEPAKKEPRVE